MRSESNPKAASAALVLAALLGACTPSVDGGPSGGVPGDGGAEPNRPPPAPVVVIEDSNPGTAETIEATLAQAVVDPDGDVVGLRWSWRRLAPGPADGPDDADLTAEYTTKGDLWEVQAVAFDGRAESEPGVAQVQIGDTAPVLSLSLLPTVPRHADTLLALATASDADGDACTTQISWSIGGEEVGTGPMLPPGVALWTQEVVVTAITTADGVPSAPEVRTLWIRNSPAIAERIDLSPAHPTVAGPITASGVGEDADGGELYWTWTWEVDGAVVSEAGTTLQPSHFARGAVVRAHGRVVDKDGLGFGRWSPAVLVGNARPSAGAATLSPPSLTAASTATCTPEALVDLDGDTVDWAVRWFVDGLFVAEGESLTAPAFARGDLVHCEVVPHDGLDEGTAVASGGVVVDNTPPTVPSPAIDPALPQAGEDDLLCEIEGPATDADGDPLSYTITWSVDGAPWPAPGAPPGGPEPLTLFWPFDTVPAEATASGQNWACEAIATDGLDAGAPATAMVVVGGPVAAPDFSLVDANPNSLSFGAAVSPRDLLQQVSGWYFIHST